ncbi:hypothetical protein [Enterobacter ludwigii]|uniref:hypothetical protein n=1 Tax=Enterobacter ludwigii TaxID=299767 RepID=UPI003F722A62
MDFKNLSGDARYQATSTLSQLIVNASPGIDEVSAKEMGKCVALAFIAMEGFDGAPDKSADDKATKTTGCDGQVPFSDWTAPGSVFRGMTQERIADMFDKYGFRDQLGHDLRNTHEFVLLTKAVESAYGSPESTVIS